MSFNSRVNLFVAAAMVLLFFAAELDARGRGGRGGGRSFSRAGVAGSGRLSSSPRSQYSQQRRDVKVQGQQRGYGQQRRIQSQGQSPGLQGQGQGFNVQAQGPRRPDRQVQTRDQRQETVSSRRDSRESGQRSLEDRQEDRQDFIEDRQEDRQDFADDRWDDYDDHHNRHDDDWDDGDFAAGLIVGGVVVGGAAAIMHAEESQPSTTHVYRETVYVSTLPCDPSIHTVQGVTFYRCGADWFQRSFSGSQVTYIAAPPPPGY